MFDNKEILITGATGSFGNKFIDFLLENFKPKRIVIFSRDELKQHKMMNKYSNYKNIRFFLGDVRDYDRLNEALYGVNFVVHAAAIKHVTAAEYNPYEAIKTNIIGAENLIKACFNNQVDKVIALSTDKAASPVNLYGATKLVSEKLFVAANNIAGKRRTIFSVVRYGNVAKSRGSVIPKFIDLKNRNSKFFPITDKKMTRFWITLEEGVDFVHKSFLRMSGGEIFIPKIPSVNITDVATAIDKDIPIKVIGIRPGEKLHESMLSADESINAIEFKNFFVIRPSISFFTKNKNNYLTNNLNEKGKLISKNFSYTSDKNIFLKINKIKSYLKNN